MSVHIYCFWTSWFWLVLQFLWTGFISGFNFGFMVLVLGVRGCGCGCSRGCGNVAAAVRAGAALLSGPCQAGCDPAPTNLPGVAVARYSQQAGKQEARQQASSIRARSLIDGKALPPHWHGIMFRRLRAQRRLEINATSSGRLLVRSWTSTRTGKV